MKKRFADIFHLIGTLVGQLAIMVLLALTEWIIFLSVDCECNILNLTHMDRPDHLNRQMVSSFLKTRGEGFFVFMLSIAGLVLGLLSWATDYILTGRNHHWGEIYVTNKSEGGKLYLIPWITCLLIGLIF